MTKSQFKVFVELLKVSIADWEKSIMCCHDLRNVTAIFLDNTRDVEDD